MNERCVQQGYFHPIYLDHARQRQDTPRGGNRVRASTFGQSMINTLQLLEARRNRCII